MKGLNTMFRQVGMKFKKKKQLEKEKEEEEKFLLELINE